MYKAKKIILKIGLSLITPILFKISMPLCTRFQFKVLSKLGVHFDGEPRYISGKTWFDGGGYEKIYIGKRVTISSNVRILVHDWALDTIYEGVFEERNTTVVGKIEKVTIGDYSFIGTGAIIMPGVNIGKCCIIGAGACVRGVIPDYSIVIGNPSVILDKSSKEYLTSYINRQELRNSNN